MSVELPATKASRFCVGCQSAPQPATPHSVVEFWKVIVPGVRSAALPRPLARATGGDVSAEPSGSGGIVRASLPVG